MKLREDQEKYRMVLTEKQAKHISKCIVGCGYSHHQADSIYIELSGEDDDENPMTYFWSVSMGEYKFKLDQKTLEIKFPSDLLKNSLSNTTKYLYEKLVDFDEEDSEIKTAYEEVIIEENRRIEINIRVKEYLRGEKIKTITNEFKSKG